MLTTVKQPQFDGLLLKQSNTFRENQSEMGQTLIMDSGDQESERGITITAKQTAVYYKDYKINIIDTPGHADFSRRSGANIKYGRRRNLSGRRCRRSYASN